MARTRTAPDELTATETATMEPSTPEAPEAAPDLYAVAEGGWWNGRMVRFAPQTYVHPDTQAEIAETELVEGEQYGVYTAEDLSLGKLMRWHGVQVVKAAPEAAPEGGEAA